MSEQESLKISQQSLEEVEQVLALNKVKPEGFGAVLTSGGPCVFEFLHISAHPSDLISVNNFI